MSDLFFTGSRDHALLAQVIDDVSKRHPNGYLGRTALQKVVYFLKAVGVPMAYRFAMHRFGPFSDQIGGDMELLIADGVVRDCATPGQKYSDYEIASAERANELRALHADFLGAQRDRIQAVVGVFGSLAPDDLELYATLHYAFRYEQAMLKDGAPSKTSVLDRFREYKGEKFTAARLDTAYAAMAGADLIRA